MQTFKGFFLVLRRKLGMVIMYASIFLSIVITISGFMAKEAANTFMDAQTRITIIDRDGGEAAAGLTGYLYGRNQPFPLPDEQEALRDALYARDTSYILFIPSGWHPLEDGAQTLESAQVPGSSTGVYADTQVSRYVATLRAYLAAGFSQAEAALATQEDLGLQMDVKMADTAAQGNDPMYFYFSLLPYAFLMMMIFGMSPVLMTFDSLAVAVRTNASALPLRRKNSGLALGALVMAASCYLLFILIALAMYGRALITPEGGLLMINALVFMVLSVSIALLLSQISANMGILSALGNVTGLSLCFLGGVYVPLTFLGGPMRIITKFTPTYWYVISVGRIEEIGKAYSSEMMINLGMQALFIAAFASLALLVSRARYRAPLR